MDLGDSLVKSKGPVSIAVDASGIKVHNGGDWIRRVWKVRKGYLKMEYSSLWTCTRLPSCGRSSSPKIRGRLIKGHPRVAPAPLFPGTERKKGR